MDRDHTSSLLLLGHTFVILCLNVFTWLQQSTLFKSMLIPQRNKWGTFWPCSYSGLFLQLQPCMKLDNFEETIVISFTSLSKMWVGILPWAIQFHWLRPEGSYSFSMGTLCLKHSMWQTQSRCLVVHRKSFLTASLSHHLSQSLLYIWGRKGRCHGLNSRATLGLSSESNACATTSLNKFPAKICKEEPSEEWGIKWSHVEYDFPKETAPLPR